MILLNTFFQTMKKKRRFLFKIIAISLVTNVLVSSLVFSFFNDAREKRKQELVTVDLLKIIDDYSAIATRKSYSTDRLKKSAQAFSQRLEGLLALYAREKHVVIMPKQAVMVGADDITPQIESLLFKKPETEKEW